MSKTRTSIENFHWLQSWWIDGIGSNLAASLPQAVTDAVNRSMANTVVHNVGLFVSVFDLLEIGDSFLLHDGCSHTAVTFRALVFRPFVEEVLVGRIKSCSQQVCALLDHVFLPAAKPRSSINH